MHLKDFLLNMGMLYDGQRLINQVLDGGKAKAHKEQLIEIQTLFSTTLEQFKQHFRTTFPNKKFDILNQDIPDLPQPLTESYGNCIENLQGFKVYDNDIFLNVSNALHSVRSQQLDVLIREIAYIQRCKGLNPATLSQEIQRGQVNLQGELVDQFAALVQHIENNFPAYNNIDAPLVAPITIKPKHLLELVKDPLSGFELICDSLTQESFRAAFEHQRGLSKDYFQHVQICQRYLQQLVIAWGDKIHSELDSFGYLDDELTDDQQQALEQYNVAKAAGNHYTELKEAVSRLMAVFNPDGNFNLLDEACAVYQIAYDKLSNDVLETIQFPVIRSEYYNNLITSDEFAALSQHFTKFLVDYNVDKVGSMFSFLEKVCFIQKFSLQENPTIHEPGIDLQQLDKTNRLSFLQIIIAMLDVLQPRQESRQDAGGLRAFWHASRNVAKGNYCQQMKQKLEALKNNIANDAFKDNFKETIEQLTQEVIQYVKDQGGIAENLQKGHRSKVKRVMDLLEIRGSEYDRGYVPAAAAAPAAVNDGPL